MSRRRTTSPIPISPPTTSSVTVTTSKRLLAQFDARAGYQRPPEQVDPAVYEELIAADEAGLAKISA